MSTVPLAVKAVEKDVMPRTNMIMRLPSMSVHSRRRVECTSRFRLS